MHLLNILKQMCQQAFDKEFPGINLKISLCATTNRKFGHYQCNTPIQLNKKFLGMTSIQIAKKICNRLKNNTIFSEIDVVKPGFINFTISTNFLNDSINYVLQDKRLGCPKVEKPKKVIIDFSSPNIAKEMHVGHLRSTIIGDAIARLLEFLGHDVLRLNHLGDWGTQFGMLINFLLKKNINLANINIKNLMNAYKKAKIEFDDNIEFRKESQQTVVKLQSEDPDILDMWKTICKISISAFEAVYCLLNVRIQERGESFYNHMLPEIVKDLSCKNLITKSNGAKCVFLSGFNNREGNSLPLIVQKSNGGYNYTTTDIAALRHRVEKEHGTWLIYVTDSGQSQHFDMVFAVCRKAKYYDPNQIRINHITFGLVLRNDGKKFKTREGDTKLLTDLINTAQKKAHKKLCERETALTNRELSELSQILGINAIKYADLSCNRIKNYTFSFNRMLKFKGNTAAFICYAYVRVQSIKRKTGIDIKRIKKCIKLQTNEELELGLLILRFTEIIYACANDLFLHRLTDYLFTLAEKFHSFFHNCRVEGIAEQNSRLLLCELVANTLKQGLEILGLKPLTKM